MNGFAIGYLLIVTLLVLAVVLNRLLQKGLVIFTKILFFVSIIGALVGVFTVAPFVKLAEHSLKNAGTLESLQKIDEALPVTKVISPVKDIVEKIKNMWNKNEINPNTAMPINEEVGLLEAEVYPHLVSLIAQTYRSATMLLSLLGLVLSVYMSFSVAGITELEELKNRIASLEKVNTVQHG